MLVVLGAELSIHIRTSMFPAVGVSSEILIIPLVSGFSRMIDSVWIFWVSMTIGAGVADGVVVMSAKKLSVEIDCSSVFSIVITGVAGSVEIWAVCTGVTVLSPGLDPPVPHTGVVLPVVSEGFLRRSSKSHIREKIKK